ncbi:MAG: D-glycero-beta-D-manno-heptose 1-phosphate adenylyltransferase [Candidatus Pelagibacter sp. TMED153]|nr:MAG: D-glycero-beta-D-manno-heptose 1-phosphate adenylyltransferase [Candidatus Pelagibacter sp. TMED153]|tara:strand:+ start:194 stop:658 length:465 start_codon:yes stop_codon:yes gene_type:complete
MNVISVKDIKRISSNYKSKGLKIVFTNGCFDLLHKGHLDLLKKSSKYGDKLIVGLNSDSSIKKLKGASRPVENEMKRFQKLMALNYVDHVIIFEQITPKKLISELKPDVLVKGGDYELNNIIGADEVVSNGGIIKIIPLTPGFSTTSIIKKRFI